MIDVSKPFDNTAQNEETKIIVLDSTLHKISADLSLMGTNAADRVVVRLAGGCSNMDDQDLRDMIEFFVAGFSGYKDVAFSGATRDVGADGKTKIMITDAAAAIAEANQPGCYALGTVPKVDMMATRMDGKFFLTKGGVIPNPGYACVMIVEDGPDALLDYDGDLDIYFTQMEHWLRVVNFRSAGLVAWNGGGITGKEIEGSVKRGWPTILVKGSGRKTDEFAGNPEFISQPNVFVVDRENPQTLRRVLLEKGFIIQK